MQLKAAVPGVGALITGHLWLIVAAAAVPAVLACITAIVLVLSVEPGKRVEAIKALPPVISAVNKTALSNLIGLTRGRQRSITAIGADGHDDAC
jgi:hypothetical protein